MKIDIKQVISVLRSFNAPSDVVDYFTRMIPSTTTTVTREDTIMQHARRLAEDTSYVKRSDLLRRVQSIPTFKNDPRGSTEAFQEAIDKLITVGKLRLADLDEAKAALDTTAIAYQVLP